MSARREAVQGPGRPPSPESFGDLFGDLMTQSSDLFKGEAALLKAELLAQARIYTSAALVIAVGTAFGLLAAMALVAAGIIALSTYTGVVASGLIFGGILAAAAAALISQGRRHISRRSS